MRALMKWLLALLILAVSAVLLGFFLGDCNKADTPKPKSSTTQTNIDTTNMTEWQKQLLAAQEKSNLIGLGGVVLKGGEIIDQGTAGLKQFGEDAVIETDEVWHIGSITKSMTATMIARLVENGDLRWDTNVGEVFGTTGPDESWHGVTLIDLLTHTSGAKANFSPMLFNDRPDSEAALLEARRKWVNGVITKPTEREPGTAFEYSNVGYTIAGVMAEIVTGESWETLMRREVFTPLGLESAGFGAPGSKDGKPVAWGHDGKTPLDPSGRADNSPIMGPAGIVHMNLQDLAKFGYAHVSGINGNAAYLKPETFAFLHEAKLDGYSKGWMEFDQRQWAKGPISFHNGSNTMWYAVIALLPEQDMVYASATNEGDMMRAEITIIDLITDYNKALIETE